MAERKCETCIYWKKDWGVFCFNGWSGQDRKDGYCHFEIKKAYKQSDDFCSHWDDGETKSPDADEWIRKVREWASSHPQHPEVDMDNVREDRGDC